MSKGAKAWLIIAGSLVLIICISGGVMAMLNAKVAYETNHHPLTDGIKNISINTKTADIEFLISEDGAPSVVCYEAANRQHTVTVNGDTLSIELNDTRKWYEYVGFHFYSPKITVYLPMDMYDTLNIKTTTGNTELSKAFRFGNINITGSTGNIRVANASAGSLFLAVSTGAVTVENVVCFGDVNIKVSTGKTNLTNLNCRDLISDGDTGSITLKNVIASGKFDIERDTGNVRFDECDAAEIYIETNTGNVTGSLLSEKVFIARSNTGKVDVPKTVTGGRCEIETDTGNIIITIP